MRIRLSLICLVLLASKLKVVFGFLPIFVYQIFVFYPFILLLFIFDEQQKSDSKLLFSLERRWSSRTFRYGYLVTTSPQSLTLPSTPSSLRLDRRLRVLPTPMVWRAVCTRPGNAFTATFWFAITSNSDFMWASFSPQSELGLLFSGLLRLTTLLLFVTAIVARV